MFSFFVLFKWGGGSVIVPMYHEMTFGSEIQLLTFTFLSLQFEYTESGLKVQMK